MRAKWEAATNVLGVVLLVLFVVMGVVGVQMVQEGNQPVTVASGNTVLPSDSLVVVGIIGIGLLVGLLMHGKASAALLFVIMLALWAFALTRG